MAKETKLKRILVAYYSFSGSTKKLAEEIARLTGGELRPLIPEKPYAFDYNTAAKEARSQIERGYCPPLASGDELIDDFDVIFVGSPNWFKRLAPPVRSFLQAHDFSSKAVVPFCSHGGGGFGSIEEEILETAHAKSLPGFAGLNGGTPDQVHAWLSEIGLV